MDSNVITTDVYSIGYEDGKLGLAKDNPYKKLKKQYKEQFLEYEKGYVAGQLECHEPIFE